MQNQSRHSAPEHQPEDDNFDRGDAGASLTFPVQCSALKKGGYVNVKGRPCRIVDIHSSKVGKHGHCKDDKTRMGLQQIFHDPKVTFTALDLFTDKRYQAVHPSSHTVDVPVVRRTDYIVVDIRDYLTLMDDKGILRHDLPAPDGDVGKAIRDKVAPCNEDTVEVSVLSAMGEEIIVGVKTGRE